MNSAAVIFPGQGAFFPGALADLRTTDPQIDEVFAELDDALEPELGRRVSGEILDPAGPAVSEWLHREPELLQVAIFGISVATFRVLQARGLKPSMLIGHSLGEISALVSAGAFTVAQGAQIVWQRTQALREGHVPQGYMAATGLDPQRCRQLLALIGETDAVIAVENHSSQTVLSGPATALDLADRVAAGLRVSFKRLNAQYPFHSPLLTQAASEYGRRIAHLEQQPMSVRVFSPILGRYYTDEDDLTTELATHFIRRVQFADAIRAVAAEGVNVFVESGALNSLTSIVQRVLADSQPVLVAPLRPGADQRQALAESVAELEAAGVLDPAGPLAVRDLGRALLPGVAEEDFARFWAARGREMAGYVQRAYLDDSQPVAEMTPVRPPDSPSAGPTRAQVMQHLVQTYADALEYPVDVFAEDTDLEAELGVDSVKQTELLGRVSDHYGLPPRPSSFRFADHNTLGRIADLVLRQEETRDEAA